MAPNVYVRILHGPDRPHVLADDELTEDDHRETMVVQVEDLLSVELLPPDEGDAADEDFDVPWWRGIAVDIANNEIEFRIATDQEGTLFARLFLSPEGELRTEYGAIETDESPDGQE